MFEQLLENNFIYLPQFICPDHAEDLALKFKHDSEQKDLPGDAQAWNSGSCYNYTPALELLSYKTADLCDILERQVLPTYTYGRVYRKGSVLTKHTDRPACEISATIHLGGDTPWSIWIEDPQGRNRCVSLEPGDAMIYLGCIAPHWRDEYDGEWYSQIFLHYVRSSGPCAPCYFDKYKPNDIEKNRMIDILYQESRGDITIDEDNKPLVLSPDDEDALEDATEESIQNNKKYVKIDKKVIVEKPKMITQTSESKLEELIKSISDKKKKEKEVDQKPVFIRYNESKSSEPTEKKSSGGLKNKSLEDFIEVFENAVDLNLCDDIIKEYADSDHWDSALTGGGLDKGARNCDVLGISERAMIDQNRDHRLNIDNAVYESVANVLKLYEERHPEFQLEIQEDSGYELLRYKTGNFYVEHSDHFKAQPRTLSCTICLNDDYEGGEFGFFSRELKYKLKKGSILMFPSNFMYPHEVMPVTSGTRYSIITWLI